MSKKALPLSRRAVLKSAAIAPLIALGNKVAAGEVSREEACECLKENGTCPENELEEVLECGRQYWLDASKPGPFPRATFELIVRALWCYFQLGFEPSTPPEGMLVHAFHYGGDERNAHGTGKHILDNLDQFDACGGHVVTNMCVYSCGHEASIYPIIRVKRGKFKKSHYESAWREMKEKQEKRLARLREKRDLPYCISARGAGC